MILKMDPKKGKADTCPEIIEISDHEEGEIASGLEEISDISSDEEYLLRQRIEILENYNSVLEQKDAKRFTHRKDCHGSLRQHRSLSVESDALSNISSSAFENENEKESAKPSTKTIKTKLGKRKQKSQKQARKTVSPKKCPRKKSRRRLRQSSSDSDIENTVQKRILRKVVSIFTPKAGKSSLKSRLLNLKMIKNTVNPTANDALNLESIVQKESKSENKVVGIIKSIDTNNDSKILTVALSDNVDSPLPSNDASLSDDDDPELLRQLALKSKSAKLSNDKKVPVEENVDANVADSQMILEESPDSDIDELRIVALRSAFIKKTLERKAKNRKKKAKVRKSISSNIFSDDALEENVNEDLHNTDIETIDMEIDQDAADFSPRDISPAAYQLYLQQNQFVNNEAFMLRQNDPQSYPPLLNDYQNSGLYFGESIFLNSDYLYNDSFNPMVPNDDAAYQNKENSALQKQDDIEEDEELLRAQLLTAMTNSSKTLIAKEKERTPDNSVNVQHVPSTNLVIKLGDSDSESECEETKNLEIMHKKLSNQNEFQKNLDAYLKSFRLQANRSPQAPERPATVQQTKHTPMAVKHLPESHQKEYRFLIKRMAEIENAKRLTRMQSTDVNSTLANTKTSKSGEALSVSVKVTPMSAVPQVVTKKPTIAMQTSESDAYSKQIKSKETFFRQKIEGQTKMIQDLVDQEKALNSKYKSEMNQLRALKASMRESERALRLNNKSQQIAHNSLIKLRKQHNSLRQRLKSASIYDKINSIESNSNNLANRLAAANVELKSMKSVDRIVNKNVPQKLNVINTKTKPAVKSSATISNVKTKPSNAASRQKIIETPVNDPSKIKPKVTNTVVSLGNQENAIKKDVLPRTEELMDVELKRARKQSEDDTSVENKSCANLKDDQKDCFDVKTKNKTDALSDKRVDNVAKPEIEKTEALATPLVTDSQNNVKLSGNVEEEKLLVLSVAECENGFVAVNALDTKENDGFECETIKKEIITDAKDRKDSIADLITSKGSDEKYVATKEGSAKSVQDINSMECATSTDYESPLKFLDHDYSWTSDTQSIFCPFEVAGSCRDENCKHFHPKT